VVALAALTEEKPMYTTVRRSLVAAATLVWLALLMSPAQALIPPEPGAPAIAPPTTGGDVGTSFFDRVSWMAAGAGIVLAVVVVGGAALLLSRSHRAHALHAPAH
jgi:hypothetical protein